MKVSIFWLRRDLRLYDNTALYYALKGKYPVLPLFIFDKNILEKLHNKYDARVAFIHQQLMLLNNLLKEYQSGLLVKYGDPQRIWEDVVTHYKPAVVYANRDYEPYAKIRDGQVNNLLQGRDVPFFLYKDQCVFDGKEIVKKDGKPYTVFTPYSKVWRDKIREKNGFYYRFYPIEPYKNNFYKIDSLRVPSLKSVGFKNTSNTFPEKDTPISVLRQYEAKRNYPAANGTSRLSVHLRFGTISIRRAVKTAISTSEAWLNELIWRDFYMMILDNFPYIAERAFKKKYEHIVWINDENEFKAWCEGNTGYPIVDAGMRELNATGFMHNRVRMIVASFLVKHLLIDWRWGEAYFAEKLIDFDLSANNGGWQWAAGSGCDAAPYFRVFNPQLQTKKFDPRFAYIKKWLPEFQEYTYPKPIVEHDFARRRAIDSYKKYL